jgi:cation:H+ antiporter
LIGLTVVAIGTSAPELVTTLVSTVRGNRDIAIGNLLGSSVYNIALILGATMIVAPAAIEVPSEVVRVDVPVMTATALLCIPLFVSGRRVSRVEGAILVACYLGYLGYLILGHR